MKEKFSQFLTSLFSGAGKALNFIGDSSMQKLTMLVILVLVAALVISTIGCAIGWML